jgi:hypothetical protein
MVPIVSSLVTSVVGSSLIAPLVPSIIPSIASSLVSSVSHIAPIVSGFSLSTLIPSSRDFTPSRLTHISLVVVLHLLVLYQTHRFFLPLAFHTTRLVLSPLLIPLLLFRLSLLPLPVSLPPMSFPGTTP